MLKARQAGKVRYIGFTGHKSPEIHLHMLDTASRNNFTFDTVQMPLNVMDAHYDSFEKLALPVLAQRNIGALGMKPMSAQVILQSGVVDAQECLRYALSLPIAVVITGCDSMPILHQALNAARNFRPLDESERTVSWREQRPWRATASTSSTRQPTTSTQPGKTRSCSAERSRPFSHEEFRSLAR
jgi:predicted aldo/keto reductase-like oxidoreductase